MWWPGSPAGVRRYPNGRIRRPSKPLWRPTAKIFKITPAGYSHLVAVPGVIQFVPDLSKTVGGTYTGVYVLTYMFSLMGIHASPAFSMWAFANKNPRPFPLQQVWASTLGIGFALMIFTTMQSMGGWVLGLLPGTHGPRPSCPLTGSSEAGAITWCLI